MVAILRCMALAAAAASAAQPVAAAAAGFLAPGGLSREAIVESLRQLLGHEGDSARMDRLKDILRPTFAALPKDANGGVGHRVAKYALHRYFIVQHAWHIKGLTEAPRQDETGALAGVLKAKMPSVVLEVLDEELQGKAVGLEELAVLAATIEDLVHSDAVDLLASAYRFHDLPLDGRLSPMDADTVLKTFILFFMLPEVQQVRPRALKRHLGDPSKLYPGFDDVWLWAADVRLHELAERHAQGSPFVSRQHNEDWEFPAMSRWASQVVGGVGRFQDLECKAMRNVLVDLEDEGRMDGRVRLGRFYGPMLEGSGFHFSESSEYLRHLGALDETDPAVPSVIVPNIIYSRSNCLATSGFHSVCCIDDCETLMSQVEDRLAAPAAEPERVAEVVASIGSESVAAPRALPAALLERLGDIAARHGGRVPLHGRLFAQWMHYAYPNECRHPSGSGEVPMTPLEWRDHWNRTKSIRASHDEMAVHQRALENATADLGAEAPILWSDSEELLSDDAFSAAAGGWSLRALLRALAMAGASLAGLASLLRQGREAKAAAWEPRSGGVGGGGFAWSAQRAAAGLGSRASPAEDTKAHFV